MRTLVHVSDLHFGKTEPHLEQALHAFLEMRQPDLVIVSGDLTQRATPRQFRAAAQFFSTLSAPLFVVPGNHDIPLYSFWNRCVRPYANYKTYISPELESVHIDSEIAVVGLNTVRAFKIKEGRVNSAQTKKVERAFHGLLPGVVKIIVSHHPFNIPRTHYKRPLSHVRQFWRTFAATPIDLFLSGHLHDTLSRYADTAYKVPIQGGPLLVQAGTAISTRRRREGNAFNVIMIDYPNLSIERYVAEKSELDFKKTVTEHFVNRASGWTRKEAVFSEI